MQNGRKRRNPKIRRRNGSKNNYNNGNGNNNGINAKIKSLQNQLKNKETKKFSGNKGKIITIKGVDFIRQIDVFPVQLLDGSPKDGIKLVAKYEITPSAFPNTRIEIISNTYQLYRFTKLRVSYTSLLPTAVNGLFIAYIDTDPKDKPANTLTSTDLLRLARSHQGSVQGKIRDNWSLSMPQRRDDQFFFIGDTGQERFTSMGNLYIYQVGQATKFDGTPLDVELSAGALNLQWTCEFMNPQLSSIQRIYDGVSEKDITRIYQNMSWYRRFNSNNVTSLAQIPGTRFRQVNLPLSTALFAASGPGDYKIIIQPLALNLNNSVKQLNTFALPYTNGNYSFPGTDIHTAVTQLKLTAKQVTDFIDEAYKVFEGGIIVARTIYDVVQIVSAAFILGHPLGDNSKTIIDDPLDVDIDHSDESQPMGMAMIHYDGRTPPLLQTLIEYEDPAHAADTATSFDYSILVTAYKLTNDTTNSGGNVRSVGNTPVVEPSLPYLPQL